MRKIMAPLKTKYVATIAEIQDSDKLLDRADGEPVAEVENSALVGHLVLAESISRVTGWY